MTAPTLTPYVEATDLVTATSHVIHVDRDGDGQLLLHLDPQNAIEWEALTAVDVQRLTGDLSENTVRWVLARYMAGHYSNRMVPLTDGQASDLADMLRHGS